MSAERSTSSRSARARGRRDLRESRFPRDESLVQPGDRMAPVVKDTHAVVRVRQPLEHAVEAVHRDVRNEHRDPCRTERGAPPPCGREPLDITWPEDAGAEIRLIDEDAQRRVPRNEGVELIEHPDDGLGPWAARELDADQALVARNLDRDVP